MSYDTIIVSASVIAELYNWNSILLSSAVDNFDIWLINLMNNNVHFEKD